MIDWKATFIRLLSIFYLCSISAGNSIELEGRWVSTKVEKVDDNSGIGVGWIVTFRPDGTYSEAIDGGFGIVEEWDGIFSVEGDTLSVHRSGFQKVWKFRVEKNEDLLQISRISGGELRYKVELKPSDAEHPELSELPRWPRSKDDAVVLLKDLMSEADLDALAATPRDHLIGNYHFGLGMYIRNGFGLWRGNEALRVDLSQGEVTHPDELSGMIIEALWEALRKQRGDHEEYIALEKLYDSLEVDALPVRNLKPGELLDELNQKVNKVLERIDLGADALKLVLVGEEPENEARLNTLPLLKVWGKEKQERVPLKDYFRGFSVALRTPNRVELTPLYRTTGWFSRSGEATLYMKADYEEDYFEMATEVSDWRSSLSWYLPGVYSKTNWTMHGRDFPLDWTEIRQLLLDHIEIEDQGTIMEFAYSQYEKTDPLTYFYHVTTCLEPRNAHGSDSFRELGELLMKDHTRFLAKVDDYSFDADSKWVDLSIAPRLSTDSAIEKLTAYLSSLIQVTGRVEGESVRLRRVNFSDYWIYEIRLFYDDESNVSSVRAFVSLAGDIIPFEKE